MEKKTSKIKIFMKIIIFSILFIFSYLKISDTFILHSSSSKDIADSFYAQPKDTIDVVFLGTCHTYSTYMPLKIWDDFGITSHIFASPGQNMAASYYYFMESVKEQHPKVVVLDVYSINREDSYITSKTFQDDTINAFHNLPTSIDKLSYALDYDEEPNKLNLIAGLYMYHQRWDYQGEVPITYTQDVKYDKYELQKGFRPYWNIELLENPESLFQSFKTTRTKKFDQDSEKYLRKIIETAQKEDIGIILVAAPYTLKIIEMERLNMVDAIAKEYQVPFVNFNKTEVIRNINLRNSDMIDSWHVNYSGAIKLTDYIGKYIYNNYSLSNKKNDLNFQTWNNDVKTYFNSMEITRWKDLITMNN